MKTHDAIGHRSSITHLLFDFLHVTQKAALASYPWIGRLNKMNADGAGTEAMRECLNQIEMNGTIIIGEGEMDEAPMLFIGEKLGTGKGPAVDIAVDPVEGTTLMSKGQENSLAVLAVAKQGTLLHAPDMYMMKLATGPKAKGKIDLNRPLTENIKAVAKATGKDIRELTVTMQDRLRHQDLMNDVLNAGAKLKTFPDVDINGVIATALDESDIDLFVGTGGAPEGVVAATALKCLGGDFQGKLVARNEKEFNRCLGMGIENPDATLTLDEIVRTDDCFFVATGITDGMFLKGVRRLNHATMKTHSFIAMGRKRIQFIETQHVAKEIS